MAAKTAQIPNALREQIQAGQVVLFLGPGSNRGVSHPQGKQIPSEDTLLGQISGRFLGQGFRGTSLAQVVELAIYKTDLFSVQNFISENHANFQPAKHHELLTGLTWAAIFTTNYDTVIEKAYRNAKEPRQRLVNFVRNADRVDNIVHARSDLPCFYLHGNINYINDPTVPLILSHEQYQTHMSGRSQLFERLEEYAYDHSIILVLGDIGSSGSRSILQRLSNLNTARPRSYLLVDSISETEKHYWSSRKLDCIEASFEDFVYSIDKEIPKHTRSLSLLVEDSTHPIERRFIVPSSVRPSSTLMNFLTNDADYLHKGFTTKECDSKAFYKGYFPDWGPIEQNLDVKRAMLDDVMVEIFLNEDQSQTNPSQELFIVKGHAGSGKTVFSHRLAWDSAHLFERLSIYLKPARKPAYEPLAELMNLTKKRLYLFVDDVLDVKEEILSIISLAHKDKLSISIIGTARNNAWNDYGRELEPFVTQSYELKYLNEKEISFLISLLQQHSSLGHLEELSIEDQKEALSKKAGRQLLVALHEATLGKPFREIVRDEYDSISSQQAKSLYLTVCILHRLGVETRAGLIARIHQIPFSLFKEKLFRPLDSIVFAQETQYTRDFVYRSRHQHIAEMVFEAILTDQRERYDEYIRLIEHLDVGYSSDRNALYGLIIAKELSKLFDDTNLINDIYRIARKRFPNEYHICQQQAIFEMKKQEGDLDLAENLLRAAKQNAPWSSSIDHSLAELNLKRAEKARSYAERKKYREESRRAASALTGQDKTSHPHHTLLKIALDELEEILEESDDVAVNRKIKEIEKRLLDSLQLFPGDSYLLESESRLRQLLNDHPKAMAALEKAFRENTKSAFIASRLAKMREYQGDIEGAIRALKECIEINSFDKDLHYQLAMLMIKFSQGTKPEILHYLRNSFIVGDSRYDAQLWYARELYLNGNHNDAMDIFRVLRKADIDNRQKRKPQAIVIDRGTSVRYEGILSIKEHSSGYIQRDKYGDRIYYWANTDNDSLWHDLKIHSRVSFELAFNFHGPIAVALKQA